MLVRGAFQGDVSPAHQNKAITAPEPCMVLSRYNACSHWGVAALAQGEGFASTDLGLRGPWRKRKWRDLWLHCLRFRPGMRCSQRVLEPHRPEKPCKPSSSPPASSPSLKWATR